MRGDLSSPDLSERIRLVAGRFITPDLRRALEFETARLAAVLRTQTTIIPS